MSLDLDDNEKAALVELLRETIERDRYPLSPRVQQLRGILAKLDVGPAPVGRYRDPRPPARDRRG